jgi:hypothetical protein
MIARSMLMIAMMHSVHRLTRMMLACIVHKIFDLVAAFKALKVALRSKHDQITMAVSLKG